MTKEQIADLARHIPTDTEAHGVVGVTDEEWFVVGPNCLELWWQFRGIKYPEFTEPYLKRVLRGTKVKL